jgi:hypothetical protein
MIRGYTAWTFDTMINSMLNRGAFFALLLALFAAHAADQPKQSSFGKGKPSGPLLTRAQLRECLAQQERVRVQTEETVKLQAGLERDKAEIARLGVSLKEQLAALDRSNAEAVDAHNTQAQAHDKMIDDYEARVPQFNAKVESLQAQRAGFTKGCENRRYDEVDEIAIKNGK